MCCPIPAFTEKKQIVVIAIPKTYSRVGTSTVSSLFQLASTSSIGMGQTHSCYYHAVIIPAYDPEDARPSVYPRNHTDRSHRRQHGRRDGQAVTDIVVRKLIVGRKSRNQVASPEASVRPGLGTEPEILSARKAVHGGQSGRLTFMGTGPWK